ncbi:hypothetical protein HMPREF9447_01112 [Bacteroides oleiciplenus YIT 12058]|uniref:Uncharacterized protein n=1 Tax=Bacteroides oleiciplenus YIT 12058 TaxID=742727 RepID=K9E761_9BACE|nr:hypothetical protein HMPREF9447_01112 [Bacteroides oleiciplenus YIT 12058]
MLFLFRSKNTKKSMIRKQEKTENIYIFVA